MTLLIDESFEDSTVGASFALRSGVGPQGTAPTYASGGFRGSQSLQCATSAVSLAEATSASSTTKYVSCAFKQTAAFTTAVQLLTCRGASDVARVISTTANLWRLTDGSGTTLATGTTALPTGAWYLIDLQVIGTAATARLYTSPESGTATETLTGTVTSAAMTLNRAGAGTSTTVGVQVDSLQVSNDAIPDHPRAGGATSALTASVSVSPTSGNLSGSGGSLSVTATVTASGGTGTTKTYAFDWGDGATTAAQSSASVAHSYTAVSPSRTVTDGVLNSTTTVTSATAAFTSADVGRTITATGIPASTVILSRTGTAAVMSAAATATASGVSVTIKDFVVTATVANT